MMGSVLPHDFDALRSNLDNEKVLTPDSPGYTESLKRWSETCIKPAAAVVKPASAQDVSTAVRFAVEHKIPLAVRSGGHSTSGSSSSDGGMVIDLSGMRSVTVDAAAGTVTFDAGCTWRDVDSALAEHGLATVGGTVSDTGVGGLILGGGYGWLSPRHGLSIDNLLEAQVVLASGEVVTASASENPDLFWAVRGAGQHFGVVTRFTSRAHEQGTVWGGVLVVPAEALPVVIEVGNAIHEKQTGDQCFGIIAGTPPPGLPVPAMMLFLFHRGPRSEGEKFFKPLFDAKPLADMTVEGTMAQLNSQLDGDPSTTPPRKLMGGANFVMPLEEQLVSEIQEEAVAFGEKNGVQVMIVFELLPHNKIREVDVSATAFASRGDWYQIGLMFMWSDPAVDGEVRAFNRKLVGKLKAKGIRKGVGHYNNYEGAYQEENAYQPDSAFGENLPKLQELKKKYDPENVFWKWNGLFSKYAEVKSSAPVES